MMKFNIWKYITVILIIFLLFFMWSSYQTGKQLGNSIESLSQYKKDSMKFETSINSLGQEINTQKTIIISKNKALEKTLLENSKLKEINNQIKIETATQISNIIAYYSSSTGDSHDYILPDSSIATDIDTSEFINFIDSNYILIGTGFQLSNTWYSLSGTIEHGGLNIENLSIINKDEYNLGYKKKKLKNIFKHDVLLLEVIHENPYTSTTALKNIELRPVKKWYQKTGFKIAAGFVAGSATILYICK